MLVQHFFSRSTYGETIMSQIRTREDFKAFVEGCESHPEYKRPAAFAIGVTRMSRSEQPLDVWYPCPNVGANFGAAAVFADVTERSTGSGTITIGGADFDRIFDHFHPFTSETGHGNIEACRAVSRICRSPKNAKAVITFITDLGAPPEDIHDAYLRLHLLSHRLVKPNTMNLNGIFNILPNVAWTSCGPIALEELDERRIVALSENQQLTVYAADKFPRMVDYVVPKGVRIADADRVRLGAYLGEGTTVMHEGFVNFNAGTEGPDNMVEGRISSGVFVGAGSDLGGSSSTMGMLSGGGKERVSIGRSCLLGANSGTGISLGNRCTIEAGLYVTAGMSVLDRRLPHPHWKKARELSGQDDMLFIRNSRKCRVEVLVNTKPNKPNVVLHTNQ